MELVDFKKWAYTLWAVFMKISILGVIQPLHYILSLNNYMSWILFFCLNMSL